MRGITRSGPAPRRRRPAGVRLRGTSALVALLLFAPACGSGPSGEASGGGAGGKGAPTGTAPAGGSGRAGAASAGAVPLRPPPLSAIPGGPLGASIRRGRAILLATRDSLPGNVGNALRCVSCHMDEGRRAWSSPWVGVYGRFPQYRSRGAKVITLEQRINGCFERSMNGKALALDDPAMRDIVAYMAWLSSGVPVGAKVEGQGLRKLPALAPDTADGARIFAAVCARCHGGGGQGTELAPPLWGARSFNIGAGMARLRTAAGFIRANMPFDHPDTLTDQQATDVAAFVEGHPRPDYPPKVNDWPNGDPPPDLPYRTKAGRRPASSSAAHGGSR